MQSGVVSGAQQASPPSAFSNQSSEPISTVHVDNNAKPGRVSTVIIYLSRTDGAGALGPPSTPHSPSVPVLQVGL